MNLVELRGKAFGNADFAFQLPDLLRNDQKVV